MFINTEKNEIKETWIVDFLEQEAANVSCYKKWSFFKLIIIKWLFGKCFISNFNQSISKKLWKNSFLIKLRASSLDNLYFEWLLYQLVLSCSHLHLYCHTYSCVTKWHRQSRKNIHKKIKKIFSLKIHYSHFFGKIFETTQKAI